MIKLTEKEKDVMELLIQGYSIGGAAEKLGISYGNAKNKLNEVYYKYGILKEQGKDMKMLAIRQYIHNTGLCYCNEF